MDSVLSEVDDVVHTTSLGLRRSIITERRKQKILFFFKKNVVFLKGSEIKSKQLMGLEGEKARAKR